MHRRRIDLRTDAQQLAEHHWYPAHASCGNCGITVDVLVARGEVLHIVVQKWRCYRCGLTGDDTLEGHMSLVNPGQTEGELAMEDEDVPPFLPGDELLL